MTGTREAAERAPDVPSELRTRDRGILLIRLATGAALAGALTLSWTFAGLAEAFFSGKQPPAPPPPRVPSQPAPVQSARPVVTTVVHHPYQGNYSAASTGPQAPGSAPGAAPAPPPAPVCYSTPSRPC